MRQLALVVLAAACSSPHHAMPDAAPVQLDLDVVVDHDGVFVYPNASDRDGATCPGAQFYFPSIGQDIVYEDVYGCTPATPSCITNLSVAVDDATYPIDPRSSRLVAYVDVIASSAAMLTIEGCGGSMTIPVGGSAPITATASATTDAAADSITFSWSAPPEATSALLELSAGEWEHVVRVVDPQYTFVAPEQTIAPPHYFAAAALRAPVIVPTVFGDVRVWTTDRVLVQAQ